MDWGELASIHLHPGREKRVAQGHRWVFSNEIQEPLGGIEPGSWVRVHSSKGALLGSGYINPRSLIAVRLVCIPGEKPSVDLLRERLIKAAAFRARKLYPDSSCCRLVFGESDGLPGLIVDRYGDILVYQIGTLGMSRIEDTLKELLVDLFAPRALVYRHDTPVRHLEGLELCKGIAHGVLPEEIWVDMDGIQQKLNPLGGQKTGFYLDQRDNRKALRRWAPGARMLDVFCYHGGWSLAAGASGAVEVLGVDDSSEAVEQAGLNAARNQMDHRCRFQVGEAFQFLRTLPRNAFDLIVLDPPAFAKTKSALPEAMKGYTDLNRRAMLALEPGGILVTCSCSYHLSEELFRKVLLQAGQASGRGLRLLEARGQAPDHPILLSMPETQYLKCCMLQPSGELTRPPRPYAHLAIHGSARQGGKASRPAARIPIDLDDGAGFAPARMRLTAGGRGPRQTGSYSLGSQPSSSVNSEIPVWATTCSSLLSPSMRA
ncbi:MAG: class I SAM-dependent rRNA methyltransferase [Syntrophobacteraceae bacterium]|nr:class I SAM-dependent rRNA methyltransferase [Syntrophobacteraceae bacterium]